MTEKVLDRRQLRLSIQHVSGHRRAQVMTGDREAGLPGVVFHTLLDTVGIFTYPHRPRFGCFRATTRNCQSGMNVDLYRDTSARKFAEKIERQLVTSIAAWSSAGVDIALIRSNSICRQGSSMPNASLCCSFRDMCL